MTREEIERQYKELIIPESKAPYHFEKGDGNGILAYNPLCGDKYTIYPEHPVHFHGHGCALSKASASLLMRQLEKRSTEEAIILIHAFINAVKSGKVDESMDSTLATLAALQAHDGREDCILLPWKAILDYLEGNLT